MKLNLDATKEELNERGDELLDALAKAVAPHAPELADAIQKAALPPKEVALKHKSLRTVHERMRRRYKRQLDQMNAEIASLLDGELKKSEMASPDYTAKVVAMEERAYDRLKDDLMQLGYKAEDFEEGGVLYGLSVNQLRDVVKEKAG